MPVRAGYLSAFPGAYPARNLDAVDSIDIHYTAGPTHSTIRDIAAYQVGPAAQADFPGIAYHIMVPGDGQFYLVNGLDRRVWHNAAPGANERAVGICYTGDREPTAVQIVGIRNAIKWSERELGRELQVGGHKDNYATQCPGDAWPSWREQIL